MNNSGKRYRDFWKRALAFALCASISATTIFPDNGVAFAASLEDAVASEETAASSEFAEAAVSETAPAEDDNLVIAPEEVIEGSDSMGFTGGEGGVSLVDEADPDIDLFSAANEVGEIEADDVEEAAIVAEDLDKRDTYQKEFKLEDNTRLLVMYPEAVHYEENGKWEEIDNSLIASQNADGIAVYTNRANAVNMELPQLFSADQPISLKYEDYEISFALEGALSTAVDASGVGVMDSAAAAESSLPESSSAADTDASTESETDTAENITDAEQNTDAAFDNISEETSAEASLEGLEDESEDAISVQTAEAASVTVDSAASTEAESASESTSASAAESSSAVVTVPSSLNSQTTTVPSESETAGVATVTGPEGEIMQLRMPAAVSAVVSDESEAAPAEAEQELSPRMQQIIPKNADSEVRYLSVLPQTDLVYNLTSTELKESIVLQSCPEVIPEYRFFLSCRGLTLEQQENNSILAKNAEGTEIFYLPAPYIIDDLGEYTYDVKVTLEPAEGGYILTYHMDEEWVRSPERQWPLTLDPVVMTAQLAKNIKDQYVASKATIDYKGSFLEAGYHSTRGKERIYIKFAELPYLTAADVVIDARLQMYRGYNSSLTSQVNVHEVLGNWESESLQWSNQPSYDSKYITDYDIVKDSGWYSWKVTDLVRNWYQRGNYGMMLKLSDSIENGTTEHNKTFYSSDHGTTSCRPILVIQYVNNCGFESYWDYDSFNAGRAGSASVNLFTGNFIWSHKGLAYDGARMPAAINAIYNANDRANNSFAMGYGWRTPYHQLVYKWNPSSGSTADTTYYIWEDEDGTRHYFKYKSSGTYQDESGVDMTLTTTGSGSQKYCIKDKQDNKSYFDTEGRLTKIENNQSTKSSIVVNYTTPDSRCISTVTDGAGRVYRFEYTNGVVHFVHYQGTENTDIRSLRYDYNAEGDLSSITYDDGRTVTYEYDQHLIKKAENFDGKGFTMNYDHTENGTPNRMTEIKGYDSSAYYVKSYTYNANYTTIADMHGNTLQYQFNNYGNTISVQDSAGKAVYSKYAQDKNASAKANQMTLSSKLQSTPTNLVHNSSFEWNDGTWSGGADLGGTGSCKFVSSPSYPAYLGHDSCQLIMTSTSGLVQVGTPNEIPVEPNTTYTISAYVKTTGMASSGNGLCLVVDSPGVSRFSERIKGNTDWRRVEMTFTTQSNVSQVKVFARLQTKGTAYVDCVQLEKQPTASRYNLVENGEFTYTGSTASAPYGWNPGDGSWVNLTDGRRVPGLDTHMYTMTGDALKTRRCSQNISAQGKKGDVYSLGGWAMGDVAPMTDSDRMFGIIGQFNYTDGTNKQVKVNFNPDLREDKVWQYACERMVAEKDYNSVTVTLVFDKNVNQVWFDGIQLVKDEFGNSYTYDSNGNIISVQDLREKNSTYEYSNNNLTKAVLPGGAELKYTYDSSHNVSTATSKQNVQSTFTYDKYGNNTSVKMLNANNTAGSVIEANATYTTDGNFIASLTNVDRKTILYGYNPEVGVLAWIQGLGDTESTRVQLGYDGMYRITGVSKPVTGLTGGLSQAYVEYSYEDDNLKTVSHSNTSSVKTKYTFDYAAFDALSTVYVGNKQLIHYEYDNDSHSYNLLREIYPNGGFKGYSYDSHGRVLSESYDRNNSHVVTYAYDNEDNLGSVTDKRNNITQRYLYDLSGRQTEIIQSGSASRRQKFYYDEANNLSRYDENVNGKDFTAYYNYDKDNRQSEYKIGAIHRGWLYDGYGRLYGINTIYDGKYVLKTTIYHENPDSTHVSTRVNGWKNETLGGDTRHFEYGYDSAGNIALLRMGGKTTTYRYNALQQLVRENNQAAGKTWLYTYDAGGNILTKKEYAYTTGTVGTVQKTINYTYGNSQWKDLLTAYNGKTISSDAAGNMTSDGTWTYTWEHGKQLAGQSKSGTTISYAYGADGMRLKKTVGSTTYTYAYNGSLLTNVVSSAGQNVHIRYDSEGKPVHMQYNKDGDEYYYMLDAQGNVAGLVDGSGKLVVEYTYDAWGQLLSMTGSRASDLGKANPLRYRSYVYDDETGMYYLGSRYYNPTMCRFINADSVSVVHEANGKLTDKNLFAYCDNNPVMRKDGGGEFWSVLAGAVIGAITNVATTVISNAASGSGTSFGQVVVAAVSGAASGALASTGVGFLGSRAGQAIGNAVLSVTETIASKVAGGEKIKAEAWGEAIGNGIISCAVGLVCGSSIAYDNAELQQARHTAYSSWKARNQTLGAVISGTADRAALHESHIAYKATTQAVRNVAQPQMLTTNVLFGLTTTHSTMLKSMNGAYWKWKKEQLR